MAFIDNTPSIGRRKPFSIGIPSEAVRHGPAPSPSVSCKAPRCPTTHLTVDQYVLMLACIEQVGGVATLEEIAWALPDVRRPISAVLDLCDAGILGADFEASFDANMRVWRIDG